MKKTKKFLIIIPFLAVIIPLLFSCASAKNHSPEKTENLFLKEKTVYNFLLSEIYYNEGNYNESIKILTQALESDPFSPYLHSKLAYLYVETGNLEKAREEADSAFTEGTDSIGVLYNIGEVYSRINLMSKAGEVYKKIVSIDPEEVRAYMILSLIYNSTNETEKTENVYRKLINTKPDIGYYYLGIVQAEQKKYEEAMVSFKKSIEINPYFESAFYNLVNTYSILNAGKESESFYRDLLKINPESIAAQKSLALFLVGNKKIDEGLKLLIELEYKLPDDPSIQSSLGNIYLNKKEFETSEKYFRNALLLNPFDSATRIDFITVLESMKHFEEALSEVKNILESNPRFVVALLHESLIYSELGEHNRAIESAEKALEADSSNPNILFYLGRAQFDASKYEDAIESFKTVVKSNPENADYHFYLATAYDKTGNFEETVKELRKAIEADENFSSAYNYLGYLFADKGINLDESISLIMKALGKEPDNGYYLDSLGWVYFKKGNIEKALSLIKEAIEKTPDDPVIAEHLGDIYFGKKMINEAITVWEKALKIDPENSEIKEKLYNAKSQTKKYIVKEGDTLSSIAAQPEVLNDADKWKELYDFNNGTIENPDSLPVGLELMIPDSAS